MSDLPANVLKTLETIQGSPNKIRSPQEINARYRVSLENYRNLCFMSGDVREQKAAAYAEVKILGWVLNKSDKEVINDISAYSPRPNFPQQS